MSSIISQGPQTKKANWKENLALKSNPLSLRKYCGLNLSALAPNLTNSKHRPQGTFGKNGGLKKMYVALLHSQTPFKQQRREAS